MKALFRESVWNKRSSALRESDTYSTSYRLFSRGIFHKSLYLSDPRLSNTENEAVKLEIPKTSSSSVIQSLM